MSSIGAYENVYEVEKDFLKHKGPLKKKAVFEIKLLLEIYECFQKLKTILKNAKVIFMNTMLFLNIQGFFQKNFKKMDEILQKNKSF